MGIRATGKGRRRVLVLCAAFCYGELTGMVILGSR
jgi:hypothetical protein